MKPATVIMELSDTMKEKLQDVIDYAKKLENIVNGQKDDISKMQHEINNLKEIVSNVKEYDDTTLIKSFSDLKDEIDSKVSQFVTVDVVDEKIKEIEVVHGKDGKDGTLTKVKLFDGEELEALELVKHDGRIWQNLMTDNKSVPNKDNHSYQLLIDKPENGKDGKSFDFKGVYDSDKEYDYLDIVFKDNASWCRTKDPDGGIPSAGWKLIAKAVRGKKGEKGETGDFAEVDSEYLKSLNDEILLLKEEMKNVRKK